MVSRNTNPGDGFFLDSTGMTLPDLGAFSAGVVSSAATTSSIAVAAPATVSSSDDPSKKVRKPYTITKSRESWTEPEHDKFLEALHLFDRDWKKIEAFIGSKTVIQIRSHAQKYFLKVQKSGTGEHLPPPRPKRKAAHPYPQKAPKNAEQPQASGSIKSKSTPNEPIYMMPPESSSIPMSSPNIQTISFSPLPNAIATNNCSSSSENAPRLQLSRDPSDPGKYSHSSRVLPDFARVYSFIGSVFDPYTTDHLQKLKTMDPIDMETVLLLMRNLSVNLTNPDFEDHRQLLSTGGCEIGVETADHGGGTSKPEIST